eukprot:gene18850-biopygen2459
MSRSRSNCSFETVLLIVRESLGPQPQAAAAAAATARPQPQAVPPSGESMRKKLDVAVNRPRATSPRASGACLEIDANQHIIPAR